MATTINDSSVALTERKKSNKITADSIIEARRKNFISPAIISAISVRISGRPLLCTSRLFSLEKSSASLLIEATMPTLAGEAIRSLLIRSPISHALVLGL